MRLFFRRPITECSRWRSVALHAVGGLTEVGVSGHERWLLVVSHSGRGLIDLETGARAARDDEAPALDSPWIKRPERLVQGIGPAQEEWFSVVGLWGGNLPYESSSGWQCKLVRSRSSERAMLSSSRRQWLVAKPVTEVKAFGFSPSGNYLVLGTSSELAVWRYEV
jgi:hypothetical protein